MQAQIRYIYLAPAVFMAVVESHNAVLSTHSTIENSECNFLVGNEAVYNICHLNLDTPRSDFEHVNSLMTQVVRSVISSFRFDGSLNVDPDES